VIGENRQNVTEKRGNEKTGKLFKLAEVLVSVNESAILIA
jgi:hypothetical protein